jgi:glycerol-3-phosphate acyltransferase PlsY
VTLGQILGGLAAVVVFFLIGSVNPASVLARAYGKDLRASGSGNPGATNAGRVLGVRWGVVVGVLDVLKALLPTVLLLRVGGLWPALAGGLAVVLGHMFSPFLHGHGGKGVAAAFGAILAVAPWAGLGAVVVFGGFVAVVRTVGRASVLTCLVLLAVGVAGGLGLVGLLDQRTGWWLAVLSAVVISRHHRNIRFWWAARRAAHRS